MQEIYLTNMENNYWIQLQNTGLDALKVAFKKEVHKVAEAIGEFIGNKIADKIMKQKPVIDENSRNVEEIVTPQEKIQEIFNELRQVS